MLPKCWPKFKLKFFYPYHCGGRYKNKVIETLDQDFSLQNMILLTDSIKAKFIGWCRERASIMKLISVSIFQIWFCELLIFNHHHQQEYVNKNQQNFGICSEDNLSPQWFWEYWNIRPRHGILCLGSLNLVRYITQIWTNYHSSYYISILGVVGGLRPCLFCFLRGAGGGGGGSLETHRVDR